MLMFYSQDCLKNEERWMRAEEGRVACKRVCELMWWHDIYKALIYINFSTSESRICGVISSHHSLFSCWARAEEITLIDSSHVKNYLPWTRIGSVLYVVCAEGRSLFDLCSEKRLCVENIVVKCETTWKIINLAFNGFGLSRQLKWGRWQIWG